VSKSRRAAEHRGRVAEWIAALWLICKGYRILGHRLRTPFGEVDLAAFKSGALVIIEVKARRSFDAAMLAVSPWQQQRVARAAEVLAGRWRMMAAPIRFDVVVIGAGFWPKHERGAWMIEARR
jgi:putative endonuclease